MDRVAVFVDAGYVFAQGAVLLNGEKMPRSGVVLDGERLLHLLGALASEVSGLPVLRVYWYDGTSTGPTAQHNALAFLNGLKLRLGFVNSQGQQKGVDSLIVTDMISLARNGAVADVLLVSGDEDLRVGVQQAQEHGVRVHLLGIKPARGSQSLNLMQEVDSTHEWSETEVGQFLSIREPIPPVVAANVGLAHDASGPAVALDMIAAAVAGTVPAEALADLIMSMRVNGSVPPELNGPLYGQARERFGRPLESGEKRDIRRLFVAACEARHLGEI